MEYSWIDAIVQRCYSWNSFSSFSLSAIWIGSTKHCDVACAIFIVAWIDCATGNVLTFGSDQEVDYCSPDSNNSELRTGNCELPNVLQTHSARNLPIQYLEIVVKAIDVDLDLHSWFVLLSLRAFPSTENWLCCMLVALRCE